MLEKKSSSFRILNFLYLVPWQDHHSKMNRTKKIQIFYDGHCPLCLAKRDFLMRRDKESVLSFADIRSPDFQSLEIPVRIEQLEKEIHCIDSDGRILRGMEVIRAAYKAVGIGWLAAPTGWPVLRPMFDALYRWVAKNRHLLSTFSKQKKR
jgi:predicted DCC family thiol-disulfide oxidoreductase YuxK